MADFSGAVNVYNPDKQISEQITLKNLIILDKAMRLARFGVPEEPTEKPLNQNERISLRFKGLNEIIYAQQSVLASVTSAIVETNCKNDWYKSNKTDEDKKNNPFDKVDNDYNELVAILDFLDDCEQEIIKARKSKKLNDDFVWEKQDHEGNSVLELSPNFFNMMKEVETSYRIIYSIMLKHKIVSNGVNEDEDLEDKEIEDEAMRRIVES